VGRLSSHALRVAEGPSTSAHTSQPIIPHPVRIRCEYGYVLERGKVNCSSPTHRDNLFHNNVARCTFQRPCELLSFVRKNDAAVITSVPDEAASRYTISPEVLASTDTRLFEEIAETISNPKRRDDYYQLTTGSGVTLLRLLAKELTQQSPEIGAWAASEIANLQLTGITTTPTVAAFDEYRDRYEDLNGQLDAPAAEASLAAHYFAQVRRLGPLIASNLKLRMTTDAASGDLGKTVATITAVLNEEEASSGIGLALYSGRDPLKPKSGAKGRGKGPIKARVFRNSHTCTEKVRECGFWAWQPNLRFGNLASGFGNLDDFSTSRFL